MGANPMHVVLGTGVLVGDHSGSAHETFLRMKSNHQGWVTLTSTKSFPGITVPVIVAVTVTMPADGVP